MNSINAITYTVESFEGMKAGTYTRLHAARLAAWVAASIWKESAFVYGNTAGVQHFAELLEWYTPASRRPRLEA
jgi:hypothetical protein